MDSVKPLREICLTHIQWTLEEYPVDVLALLPKAIREEMLHNLPIVDICRLEDTHFTSGMDTHFTSGIDTDSIWKELYECSEVMFAPACDIDSIKNWRQRYLHKISLAILENGCPYGYENKRYLFFTPTGNNSATENPVDFVNYLVASNCPHPIDPGSKDTQNSLYHQVIRERGLVPPGLSYNKACQSKQLVPPRYNYLFPEGSCYLPDSVALELLGKECHYSPNKVVIYTHIVSTFLQSADQTTPDLSFLADYLKDVESLTIHSEKENWLGRANRETRILMGLDASPQPSIYRRLNQGKTKVASQPIVVWQATDVASAVLQVIVSTANPKLTSLSIKRCREADNFIASLAPILASSYNGLKELHIDEEGDVTLDIPKLITTTKYQHLLNSVSLSLKEIVVYRCSQDNEGMKYTPRIEELKTWIQICLEKPSLKQLKLSLHMRRCPSVGAVQEDAAQKGFLVEHDASAIPTVYVFTRE